MQVATLVIAILGVIMSALSLGWQGAAFVLSGGRVSAELRVGALHATRSGLVHGAPSAATAGWADHHGKQGYVHPVIAVLVRNRGRLPVTVTQWGVVGSGGLSYRPLGNSVGPALPYRLEAGSSELWAVELEYLLPLAEGFTEEQRVVRASVELGDGKSHVTKESVRL